MKLSRPEYADLLKEMMGTAVDYRRKPAEDFARATVYYEDDVGTKMIVEATTSWSFVGAGLRLSLELLGPEYSISASSLDGGARVFFRAIVVAERAMARTPVRYRAARRALGLGSR